MAGFVNNVFGEWMNWGDEWLYGKAGKIMYMQVHLRRRIGGKRVVESSKENEFSALGESARRLFARANHWVARASKLLSVRNAVRNLFARAKFVVARASKLLFAENAPEASPLERTLGELERTNFWMGPLKRTLWKLEQTKF
ncbi:hypothetical protein AAC387_Pa02g2148 [Persea americana]